MDVDSDSILSLRKPAGAPGQAPEGYRGLAEVRAQPADPGTSSDKRQRLAAAQTVTAGDRAAGSEDVSSSLIPLQPLTSDAAAHLQHLDSLELEQEEEAATLEAMLAAPPPLTVKEQEEEAAGKEFKWSLEATGRPPSPTVLAHQLSDLRLEEVGVSSGGGMDSTPMDAEGESEPGPAAPASTGSLQAAAAAARQGQQHQEQQQLRGDPLIRHLAAAEDAAPMQMLPLEALDRNPRLSQFQRQRVQAVRSEQTARAVMAAAALRGQLTAEDAMEQEEELGEVPLIP